MTPPPPSHTPPAEPAWDFSLNIPDGWYVRDPELASRRASTERDVDRQIADDPALAPHREDLVEILLGFWLEADQKSAIIAATVWQIVDDTIVVGNLAVFDGERQSPDSVESELAALERNLSRPEEHDVGDRDVRLVTLPAGKAVRLRWLTETEPDDDGSTLVLDGVSYWVPVPGHPATVALNGSTPCLPFADELAAAFDSIADTLEFIL